MKKITYTRPSGTTIEVADTKGNVAMAEKLGWTQGDAPKKRGRKPKTETTDD